MDQVTTKMVRAILVHLAGDWLLQNDWMARNKHSLVHPAAWIHGVIHGVLLLPVLGWHIWIGPIFLSTIQLAVLVHMLIDTRVPLRWWREYFKQTTSGEYAIHVAIWSDQVLHLLTLAAIVELDVWLLSR